VPEGTPIVAEYLGQADELLRALALCPAADWARRPEPERWSVLEIAGHLADAELLAAVRIRRILTQDRPLLYGYQQEQWARELRYRDQDLEEVAARFALLRRSNAQLLEHLAPEEWDRTGRHDENGEQTLFRLIEGSIAHTAKHVEQVLEAGAQLEARAPVEPSDAAAPASGERGEAAKFYALAVLAGLTILAVGFFMQSAPVAYLGILVAGAGALLSAIAVIGALLK
jgi:hypothetical protein